MARTRLRRWRSWRGEGVAEIRCVRHVVGDDGFCLAGKCRPDVSSVDNSSINALIFAVSVQGVEVLGRLPNHFVKSNANVPLPPRKLEMGLFPDGLKIPS